MRRRWASIASPTSTRCRTPRATARGPIPTRTATVFNLDPALTSASNNIRDNQSYLDTDYKGVDLTVAKRLSRNWQMVAGLTLGKNQGGTTNGTDLNDPNVTLYPSGIVGNDSKWALRMSGSYHLPYDFSFA